MLLKDQVCLVTGAGRGIGRSIAVSFAREGAKVAITARSAGELAETAAEIKSLGASALSITADLEDATAPAKIVQQVRAAWGPVQVLVNNAGIGSSADPQPVVSFDDAFWERTLRINLTAPYLLCKQVLPEMQRARAGRIIMVASINGKIGALHGAAYTASKHGVLGLMRTLAMEVVQEGITVNAICPGPVHTAMNDKRIAYDAARRGVSVEQIVAGTTPMGRRLEPDEIAPLAVYLASAGSSGMTGQAINIDGGVLMTG
ncbi:Putative ketoacyl reductase [Anatilimnocola aggregata]|uniref:Ketoacyl reductase n=1 Tax=Anatilimnocola aggregata TaxID=2528021 RepID=A0A517Y555_9BACT|nr:SDR family NAD(P)-dependent oxidoreductase [Anatilimnocola aggregata]QDU25367.1 Putative ketoacyl reductase [Anatilimnocola aggregata]